MLTTPQGELKFSNKLESTEFLSELYAEGHTAIAGLDEVGRGSIFGPLISACVLLPIGHTIEGIKDSKKLSPKRREALSIEIREQAIYGIGACESAVVDSINIHQATLKAAKEAVIACYSKAPIEYLLCDGGIDLTPYFPFPMSSVIKGDVWFECIGAASIVAKVYHDKQMEIYHEIWPEYGLITNCGYGTKYHVEAIKKHGLTSMHRKSFAPCKNANQRV